MILLSRGAKGPAVGVVQRIMNQCRELDPRLSSVPVLDEDGIYGRGTRAAVIEAQRMLGLSDDGTVGPDTWGALAGIGRYKIVHVVDCAIENMLRTRGRRSIHAQAVRDYLSDEAGATAAEAERFADRIISTCENEARFFRDIAENYRTLGGDPIEIRSMTDPLGDIRRGIATRSRDGWKIAILRIVGYGSAGRQIIACSPFGSYAIDTDLLTLDDDDTPSEVTQTLLLNATLRELPGWAAVELHGCSIARRSNRQRPGEPPQLSGVAYLQALANSVGRPATAGVGKQKAAYSTRRAFTYETAVRHAYPGGATPADWFRTHP